MIGLDDGVRAGLLSRGMSRRTFIKFSAAMAAALALPASYAPRIASAVAAAPRLPVIWLRGQDCAGNTEAFLRAVHPTAAQLLLDLLSVEYHESIMASSGASAEQSRTRAMETYPHGYLAVVEGAIPTADDGVYCMVGGRPFRDVVREVCGGALATIAVGSCAFDGGAPAAAGGRTGAVGVADVVPNAKLINLPGCPLNVENLTATIVHYLTFKQFPLTDGKGRPLFAYGGLLHNQCERRAHFEFGEFALSWGDEGSQKGWCLYKMGCKGPETFANCPTALYADGTSWAVKAGHGCIGCTMPRFWDAMGAPYQRLPAPLPFAPQINADHIGQALVGGVAALTVAHGAASIVRARWVGATERRAAARRERPAPAEAAVGAGPAPEAEVEAEDAPELAAPPAVPPAVATEIQPSEQPAPAEADPTSDASEVD
jgi:hydrogenase small subunit